MGFDVGSTTIKYVVTDENGKILRKKYERHFSKIDENFKNMVEEIINIFPEIKNVKLSISGSAGMGISEFLNLEFVQEVYSVKIACSHLINGADVIIELGGEDAKILFLNGSLEVRMNGSCAGGTGAFIDQMASLLGVKVQEIDELAKKAEKIYPIASRCGVFAKSDIQPLLNQGAKKEDISASILHCVVNQTISGLAQGRKICGNVVYLGGPLTFMPMLRKDFDSTLKISGICPENSLYYVALGAAFCAEREISLAKLKEDLEKKIINKNINKNNSKTSNLACLNKPLFLSKKEYEDFKLRHSAQKVKILPNAKNEKTFKAFIGIDAGSTTFKGVLVDANLNILYKMYEKNTDGPVNCTKKFLEEIYKIYPGAQIISSAVTGYGEELIKNAFGVDFGIVETMAHFIAAKRFMPKADLIIDIGGQDIKCFKIKNGAIEDIFLNEACSSGCGSFLQTFANSLGYSIKEFSELALFAKKPVDLGSRCTVFMNSSVKQAQKDGAGIDDIAAGLAISVVKNALYKVIRARSKEDLGKNIVVQGGTFLSDAVLRAFEQEINRDVIRPNIAELMGAYGCAVWAMRNKPQGTSNIISKDALESFYHKTKAVSCGLCANNCSLTVNYFSQNNSKSKKFISGNNCQRPIPSIKSENGLNIYEYKRKLLAKYSNMPGNRGTVGIPMALNMYENLPFWAKFWNSLGFAVKTSPLQAKNIYSLGSNTIPSDTICFPAKLVHGHIKKLLNEGINTIFYPCMSYNFDDGLGDNHYNCPVVAYYPETIAANIKMPSETVFIKDYVGIHNKKALPFKIKAVLEKYFKGFSLKEINKAVKSAYKERELYLNKIKEKGREIILSARAQNKEIIILSGRPYHISPEVNHNIDKLIVNLGAAVLSEDSITPNKTKIHTNVLNQWSYHARLYAAADFAAKNSDVNLVQLISFGCGIDAITSDEVREILENKGKIYTQIKIDEITNLGTVKIRLRSLFAAIAQIKAEENVCLEKIKEAKIKTHKECFLQNKIKKITQSFCQLCSRFTLN